MENDDVGSEAAPERAYSALVDRIGDEILRAQRRLVSESNATVVELYWQIGRVIVESQSDHGYGTGLIPRLSRDLRSRYPGQRGFSVRNLQYMRAFASAWPDLENVQQLLRNLGWGQIQLLLDKVSDSSVREWYARRSVSGGWTQGILADRINAQLHLREGAAPSNFERLPAEADPNVLDRLATDPYRLDFIALEPNAVERRLEEALVSRISEFLTQLGSGFAYMGRQHQVTVGRSDFFLDLLFYNTHLHSYVVFEIKARPFQPGDIGQLGFYVTAIDRQLRAEVDGPTVGVLLVTDRDDLVVEYALADSNNPMTVPRYTYNELPEPIRAELPTIAELETVVASSRLVWDVEAPDGSIDSDQESEANSAADA